MENNQPQLPPDILQAIESAEVYRKLEKIGDKHNLLLDQVGQLNIDTEQLMIGMIKSDDFVKTIAKNLEISRGTAEEIAIDINNEIFTSLRESIRKMQEKESVEPAAIPQPSIPTSPIEKAGNFTVIRKSPSQSPQYNHENLKKEDVLADLENIKNLRPENAENFVEHLLSGPVSTPAQVVEMKAEAKKTPPPPPRTGPDPYREQV